MAGGDTDTIGSVAGQVAGVRLGLSRLPRDLVSLEPVRGVLAPAAAFAQSVAPPGKIPGKLLVPND